MPKKQKKKYAKCPCCNKEKHRTEMKMVIAQKEQLDRASYGKYYKELDIDTYGGFIDSNFDWACDACLESKKAVKANPNTQNYCWYPYYAYFDLSINCKTCKSEFVFSKEEKKFWFESLKFWIDSEPVNCVTCRKEIRQLKKENKILSDILSKKEDDISFTELEKVIEIYTIWQKEDRVKYYQSVLKKRNK